MSTMGEACDGSCLGDLPDPLDGRIRSTPLEAAPAVESLEREDNEYIALSGDLVVEVRGVVPGDLDLESTIRMMTNVGMPTRFAAPLLSTLHATPRQKRCLLTQFLTRPQVPY
jgi:hypothetical protein